MSTLTCWAEAVMMHAAHRVAADAANVGGAVMNAGGAGVGAGCRRLRGAGCRGARYVPPVPTVEIGGAVTAPAALMTAAFVTSAADAVNVVVVVPLALITAGFVTSAAEAVNDGGVVVPLAAIVAGFVVNAAEAVNESEPLTNG